MIQTSVEEQRAARKQSERERIRIRVETKTAGSDSEADEGDPPRTGSILSRTKLYRGHVVDAPQTHVRFKFGEVILD